MFDFHKGFHNNNSTKIVTNYIKITDSDRIKKIKEQRAQIINQEESPLIEKKDVYRNRMNAFKNIKKD